jgi:hypothetical protein
MYYHSILNIHHHIIIHIIIHFIILYDIITTTILYDNIDPLFTIIS